ncbi:MAG TPA: amino acid racemase [Streptosporangiales bacterium]
MRTVGIIGGVGPLAGAHFYRRLVELTPATRDEDHIPVVLATDPAMPSRVAHLTGTGPSPLPSLVGLASRLVGAGAELLVIASVTTSAYVDDLVAEVDVPVLDGLAEVGKALGRGGFRHPAVLATTAVCSLQIVDSYLPAGVEPRYPDPASGKEIQRVIEDVKAGADPAAAAAALAPIADRDWAGGCDVRLLACTELPLLQANLPGPVPYLSVTDVLAEATVRAASR